ncbi:conjugal transfer pilus assembly protein TraV [Novosphingobium sp. 1748]|uniref:TraV family lipoprotein n=1 Tax=Novosphingobium sp. 1748 TaxID=2817760 RepID=UPI00285CCB1B|nr:TraV family lipoprotein [Novosphingobium sp. 1748]MDR6709289.1 conjugal transfer pilus assembly protein TraV [Novosphingobium sp. 1748]
MMIQSHKPVRTCRKILLSLSLIGLSGCAAVGSMMSPYSEKFSCKNGDHGQCIHPEKAWADAVAGRPSKSDPVVTNDRKLLSPDQMKASVAAPAMEQRSNKTTKLSDKARGSAQVTTSLPAKPSVGDVGGLATGPSTPMLRPSRTLRTLILPYADRQRPDRLYMARYVYSIIDRPAWVVGDYLVEPAGHAPTPPVLRSTRDKDAVTTDAPQDDSLAPALSVEQRP